jgi:hypothetical protein
MPSLNFPATLIAASLLALTCLQSGGAVDPSEKGQTLPAGALRNAEYLSCWHGQPLGRSTYRIMFEAVVFRREGTLSPSATCPGLRLHMVFHETDMPQGFRPFQGTANNPFERVGIKGVALVEGRSRERGDMMTVHVTRLIEARTLSEGERDEVLLRLEP